MMNSQCACEFEEHSNVQIWYLMMGSKLVWLGLQQTNLAKVVEISLVTDQELGRVASRCEKNDK